MKKILTLITCSSVILSLVGCSNHRSPEEVTKHLNETNYETEIDYSGKTHVASNGDNFYVYHKDEDVLVFSNYNTKQGDSLIVLNLDNKKAVNFSDGTMKEDKEITEESINKTLNQNSDNLKEMKLTANDLRFYLKEELNTKLIEFEEVSTKKKLKLLYPNNTSKIDDLSELQAEKGYDIYEENTDISFTELYEEIILSASNVPKVVRDSINDLNYRSLTANTIWSMENIEYVKDDQECIKFDWYLNNEDTNLDFIYLFSDGKMESAGLGMGEGQSMNVEDEYDVIAMYMVLMKSIDSTIDEKQALAIFANATEEYTPYNGYIYAVDINENKRSITMAIIAQ